MKSKTNASEQSSKQQNIISLESKAVCEHCEAERAALESVSFKTRYTLAIISGVSLSLGVLFQYALFPPVIFYVLFIASILTSGRWIIPSGLLSIIKAHLGVSTLMTLAAFGAVIIGQPAEGATVMFLFHIAELLEAKAGDRVRIEIESLINLEPELVSVVDEDVQYYVHTDEVMLGQRFAVRPGERIGLDGIVVKGTSTVNQAPITGESVPVEKSIDDEVFAGTINIEGYLEIVVTRTSEDSLLSRIIKLVQDAKNAKSPTERLVSKVSHVYTPIILAGSVLLGLFTFLLGAPINDAVYRGLTLLVISCPCAFAISIPVSMVSSIVGSAREGVLIKGSDNIESMSLVRNIAFDKTGTLTMGNLSLQDICLHNGSSREDILKAAISLESLSEHPIAQAVLHAGEDKEIKRESADDFVAIPGRGIKGRVGQETYLIGNNQLLIAERVDLPAENHSCGTGTLVYVVRQKTLLGTIILGDSIRENTIKAILELKKRKIRTIMLTGDREEVAREVAIELGIDEYNAELLPEQKVAKIRELSSSGKVMMVGDGINDTPALAAADVGVAMGVISSDAAIETADVALMIEDLQKIPRLIDRAKKTMRLVKQNVVFSISAKMVVGALAIAGIATLWMAILFGDMGITLAVIANALRLTRKQN